MRWASPAEVQMLQSGQSPCSGWCCLTDAACSHMRLLQACSNKEVLLYLHTQHICLQVTAAMEEMFTVFGSQQPATPEQMAAKDTVFAYLERALKTVMTWLVETCTAQISHPWSLQHTVLHQCSCGSSSVGLLPVIDDIDDISTSISGHCMSDLSSSPLQVRSDPGSFGWTSLGPYLADLEVQKLDAATIVMDMHKMLADGPYGLCTMVRSRAACRMRS